MVIRPFAEIDTNASEPPRQRSRCDGGTNDGISLRAGAYASSQGQRLAAVPLKRAQPTNTNTGVRRAYSASQNAGRGARVYSGVVGQDTSNASNATNQQIPSTKPVAVGGVLHRPPAASTFERQAILRGGLPSQQHFGGQARTNVSGHTHAQSSSSSQTCVATSSLDNASHVPHKTAGSNLARLRIGPVKEEVVPRKKVAAGPDCYVRDYVEEITDHMLNVEMDFCAPANYMETVQRDINAVMRGVLLDWLVSIHEDKKLRVETLHLTVNYLDRFLSVRQVNRVHLQLIGLTALSVASKYEEIYPLEAHDLAHYSDGGCSEANILYMERTMLSVLEYRCTAPTSHWFLERAFSTERVSVEVQKIALYFAELALMDYAMLRYTPSLIASACLRAARLVRGELWSDVLGVTLRADPKKLDECTQRLWNVAELAAGGKSCLSSVTVKYQQAKHSSASRLVAVKIGEMRAQVSPSSPRLCSPMSASPRSHPASPPPQSPPEHHQTSQQPTTASPAAPSITATAASSAPALPSCTLLTLHSPSSVIPLKDYQHISLVPIEQFARAPTGVIPVSALPAG